MLFPFGKCRKKHGGVPIHFKIMFYSFTFLLFQFLGWAVISDSSSSLFVFIKVMIQVATVIPRGFMKVVEQVRNWICTAAVHTQ